MLDFVRPGVLGQLNDFRRFYVQPIEIGQHSDSDPQQVNYFYILARLAFERLES